MIFFLQQNIWEILRKNIYKLFLTFISESTLGNDGNIHAITYSEPLVIGAIWLKMPLTSTIAASLCGVVHNDNKTQSWEKGQLLRQWCLKETRKYSHFSEYVATGFPNSHKALHCLRLFQSQSCFVLIKIYVCC